MTTTKQHDDGVTEKWDNGRAGRRHSMTATATTQQDDDEDDRAKK